ncbi:MAG TPA: GNAT family N-acetyltransferase [Candidatus Nanoarchaeia archaeon]|nr:GNAT family N-acetyltransferase [Candidatus Nanoarchaeia archaeon]
MKIELTKCRKKDLQNFIILLEKENMQKYFDKHFESCWSDKEYQEYLENLFAKGNIYLIYIDDKCIGFTSFSQDKKDDEALFISNLQIKKEYQNMGYGSQVLKFIEEKAKKLNYKKIKLYVFEDNPSQSLYKKFGYKQIDYIKKSDTNVMQKLII